MERDFKGVWIPKELYLNKTLSWTEKILLVEIDSLSTSEKGCFASNKFLGDFLGVSEGTCANMISKLKKVGIIEYVFFDGRNRGIKLNKNMKAAFINLLKASQKNEGKLHKKMNEASQKNEHNNTDNNTDNNNSEFENSQPVASVKIEKTNDLAVEQFKQVIDYLNLKSGRVFQVTAQDVKGKTDKFKLISKTLKTYTLEDIKLVIDDRVSEWGTDSKMSKFLQPATIFANINFEKYIEAIRAGQPKQKDQPSHTDKMLIENVWAIVGVLGCTGDKNQIGAICKRLAAIIKPEHRSDNEKIGEAAVVYIKKAKEVGENNLENMNKNFDSLLTKIKQTSAK